MSAEEATQEMAAMEVQVRHAGMFFVCEAACIDAVLIEIFIIYRTLIQRLQRKRRQSVRRKRQQKLLKKQERKKRKLLQRCV
jgi:hypothetical protein